MNKIKLKDKIKINDYVELTYANGAFGYYDNPNFKGIVKKIKGLNGSSVELTFDDNSVGYLTYTTKLKIGK